MAILNRILASANYRLNERRYRREPIGSDEYRRRNKSSLQMREIERKAHSFFATLAFTTDADFTGVDPRDYYFLDQFIRNKRPTRFLELGSGKSTQVCAAALDSYGGRLITVDHVEYYSKQTRDMLPAKLRSVVEFAVSPTVGIVEKGVSWLKYRELPTGEYQAVFVDGPSALFGDIDFPTYDIISLMRTQTGPVDVIVDRRIVTLSRLSCWCRMPVVYDPLLGLGGVRGLTREAITPPEDGRYCKPRVRITNIFDHFALPHMSAVEP